MADLFTLVFVALLGALALLKRERVLDVLLGYEDPRPLGRFRVALGAFLLFNIVSLHILGEYLFSSAGLLTTAGARFVEARAQFDDLLTPGVWTLLKYPAGIEWSPLHFWDSPLAVHLHFAALYVACLGLITGTRTTLAKWSTLALYFSLWSRNDLAWGGEQVLMIALVMLCFSDCGAAYSIDARDQPLRSVPRWPRVLLVLQLIPVYLANAIAKDGGSWIFGHAVHYSVTGNNFGRWPLTEYARELTPVFWLATHLTLYLEFCFALVVVRTLAELPGRRAPPRWASRVVVVLLAAFGGALFAHDYEPAAHFGVTEDMGMLLGIAAALGVRRILATRRGWRAFELVSSRRLWIPLGLLFHVGVFATMSVGVFVLATASYYLLLDNGDPALARDREPEARARALSIVELLLYFAGSAVVLVFAPRLWPWLTIACALLLITRARRRGVGRRRLMIPALCVVHLSGALLWVLPRARPFTPARAALFEPIYTWIQFSNTIQHWRLFAPDAPRDDTYLVVLGIDHEGRRTQLFATPAIPTATHRPVLSRAKREKLLRTVGQRRPDARSWLARQVCLEAGPEIEQVLVARRKLRLLPLGEGETIAQRRARFERASTLHELASYACDDVRDDATLLAGDRRRGAPTKPPWHLLLVALWGIGWRALPVHEARGAEPSDAPTRR